MPGVQLRSHPTATPGHGTNDDDNEVLKIAFLG